MHETRPPKTLHTPTSTAVQLISPSILTCQICSVAASLDPLAPCPSAVGRSKNYLKQRKMLDKPRHTGQGAPHLPH